jgi:prepilin-type N-terminal cleavage/methylation domain-containing protein
MAILGVDREDNGIKGFSLIEMLIVLAIIAILLMIAPSMFSAFRQRTNLREAAGALAEDMKLAKQRAVAENVNHSITFDANNINYIINYPDNPPICQQTPQPFGCPCPYGGTDQGGVCQITKSLSSFGNGIMINSQNFAGNTVTFQPRGTCSAGTITLQNNLNSTIAITTNLMGRITIGTVIIP